MKLLKELDFIHNKKVNLALNITAVLLIFPFLALFTWIAILMARAAKFFISLIYSTSLF